MRPKLCRGGFRGGFRDSGLCLWKPWSVLVRECGVGWGKRVGREYGESRHTDVRGVDFSFWFGHAGDFIGVVVWCEGVADALLEEVCEMNRQIRKEIGRCTRQWRWCVVSRPAM